MTGVPVVTAVPAVAVKPALLDPDGTFTEDGTVTRDGVPLNSATAVMLVALPDKLTAHDVVPGDARLAGVHVRLESTGAADGLIVTVPPAPPIATLLPRPSEPVTFVTETGEDVSVVDLIWNVIVAMTPFVIAVALRPAARHRTSPGETALRATCLPAALAAPPVVK